MLRLGRVIAALLAMWAAATDASAASITIVAVGASNTSGWGVPDGSAYRERLQVLLRAKGVDAQVINAGRPFDTTGGMLGRIDANNCSGIHQPAWAFSHLLQPFVNR